MEIQRNVYLNNSVTYKNLVLMIVNDISINNHNQNLDFILNEMEIDDKVFKLKLFKD